MIKIAYAVAVVIEMFFIYGCCESQYLHERDVYKVLDVVHNLFRPSDLIILKSVLNSDTVYLVPKKLKTEEISNSFKYLELEEGMFIKTKLLPLDTTLVWDAYKWGFHGHGVPITGFIVGEREIIKNDTLCVQLNLSNDIMGDYIRDSLILCK